MTPDRCQCEGPGSCPLLRRECDPKAGRKMSEVRWQECQSKPHYFEMFVSEASKPCRGTPREITRPGWGDRVAAFLERLGIKKKAGCGCEKRQAWLNHLGERIGRLFS